MGRVLWVATADGVRSPEGACELEGRRVGALALDGPRRWALVGGNEVHQRSGDGAWRMVAEAGSEARLTCLAPVSGGLLLGDSDAHVRRLDAAGSLTGVGSFEAAPGRENWYTPWGGPPAARSISVSGDGTVYVNVHVGGILRSTDGGATWSPTIDLHADVHQVSCPRPYRPDLVLAACADGLAVSRDAGETWQLRDAGLRRTYCRAVAVAGDTVLVSASDGPGGEHAGVYRAPLDGVDRFERCREGLPEWFGGNVDTGWLAGWDRSAALVSPDGRVFESADEGATWAEVGRPVPGPGWVLAA